MLNFARYCSPLGEIILTADAGGLTGLWFVGQKYFEATQLQDHVETPTEILRAAQYWLDVYFAGCVPDFTPPLHLIGTDFQQAVWRILRTIPYGKTLAYGEIAQRLAKERCLNKMSAQAVGGAVGRNKISLIIPCHRVVGTHGKLVGYAGGVDRKMTLLKLEQRSRLLA